MRNGMDIFMIMQENRVDDYLLPFGTHVFFLYLCRLRRETLFVAQDQK